MVSPAPRADLALLGLRTVIYPVQDLQSAKTWWTSILGFHPYFDQPFYVGYAVAGYELALLPDADPTLGAQAYWGVANVSDAMQIAVDAGAVVLSEATDVGEGIVTGLVRTPDGAILGLIQNPHFALSTAQNPDPPKNPTDDRQEP
ncbi:MAG: VOC family protein [Actinobacteria bacterium]|nr:VOC family protein [Actinomycetota bacterium]